MEYIDCFIIRNVFIACVYICNWPHKEWLSNALFAIFFINGQLSNEALVFTGLMIGIVAKFVK